MTLVSEIITQAYRETNLIPLVSAVSALQSAEALALLNTFVQSTIGLEVGNELRDLNVGGTYDESDLIQNWVPSNARLIVNSVATRTLMLDPEPQDGQRVGFVDASNNITTYPVTLNGNGRRIEGATTLILNVSGDTRQWLYRADTGNWVKIGILLTTDVFPFPVEFDGYFITALAMRLSPRYGQALTPESAEILKRGRKNIRGRYRGKNENYPDYVGQIGHDREGYYSYTRNEFGRGDYWWR